MDEPTLPGSMSDELVEVVGPSGLVTDPELTAQYTVDWTGRYRGSTPAVVRPASAGEVEAVIAICRHHGVAVVPQGGNTGLVGGSVPRAGELVISLRKLDAVGAVDTLGAQIDVGAGAHLAVVQAAAAAHGLEVGVDLAARDSATIGGMVATNAGGLHVLRRGPMRHHLVGHEAVLGTGQTIRHMAGLLKDNTGYDLGSLLCGSEGTLGIVTAARLALFARATSRLTALVAFGSVAAVVEAAGEWRRLPGVESLEVFTGAGLELVLSVDGGAAPFDKPHPWYALVEVAGSSDPTEHLSDAVGSARGVADVAVAGDAGQARRLWRLREDHTTAIASVGVAVKLDVGIPLPAMAEFLDRVPGVVASVAPHARTWLFGHLGDGNIHVNVTGADPDDQRLDEAVLALVAGYGGSISAEHGIGVAKRRWLHLNRTAAEVETFRAVKKALDPDGILNPGVLV